MNPLIIPITMPRWGVQMPRGTITAWHRETGQAVNKDDVLLDAETDKIVNSDRAVVRAASLTIRKTATQTLSADHRVVDAAAGVQFPATLREFIDSPQLLSECAARGP